LTSNVELIRAYGVGYVDWLGALIGLADNSLNSAIATHHRINPKAPRHSCRTLSAVVTKK